MSFEKPENLLDHPALRSVAPWCRRLEPLELAILAVTPMRGVGEPCTRGELVSRIADFGEHLVGKPVASDAPRRPGRANATPLVGDLYYQRTSRAVVALQEAGVLAARGRGRRLGYWVTPPGFVSLILNLRSVTFDPVFEPSEFELRREIIAVIVALFDGLELSSGGGGATVTREMLRFTEDVDAVTLGDVTVMSHELFEDTFDMMKFIGRSRARTGLILQEIARLEAEVASMKPVEDAAADEMLAHNGIRGEAFARAWQRARLKLPSLSLRSIGARYRAHLHYLDELTDVYASITRTISLPDYRKAKGHR